jgi:alcohol dehydrogenase class IV
MKIGPLQLNLDLVRRLGLPATLRSLGKAVLTPEELAEVTSRTLATPYIANFPRPLDTTELLQAILDADALGRSLEA